MSDCSSGQEAWKIIVSFGQKYAQDFKGLLPMYVLSSYPELKYLPNDH